MIEPNYADIDDKIIPVVRLLTKHGYQTSESCQGGPGHSYLYPTVLFYATQQGCVTALEMLQENDYATYSCRLTKDRRTPGCRVQPLLASQATPSQTAVNLAKHTEQIQTDAGPSQLTQPTKSSASMHAA